MPLFRESETIAAIDDMSAALSAQREAVIVLAARWRDHFLTEDFEELQRILDACDRIQGYHLIVRAGAGRQYREEENKAEQGA